MSGTSSVRIETEDVRRRQLIEATIESLAEVGFAACTLMDIGRRAGVSPGLVAHYFGDKEGLLEATLRHMAGRLSRIVSIRLAEARSPRARVQAVIDANLAPEEFDRRTASVWLAFWGQVIHSARFKRVQNVYQRRMLSNLRHALKQMVPARDAQSIAVAIAAVIDGLWLRETLASEGEPESAGARAIATAFADAQIATVRARSGPVDASTAPRGRDAIRNYIGGRGLAGHLCQSFTTINPATGETLAELEIAGTAEVEAAVESARLGQAVWAAMSGGQRGQLMRRAAAILRDRNDELARLETRDTGRPIQVTSTLDIASAADCLDYFAGLAGGLSGEHVDLGGGAFGYSRREPLGVVAGQGSWDVPLRDACRKLAPALAAGNAMIFMPDGQAPLSTLRLAEILTEAGLPDGVFNVLLGFAETSGLLLAHPGIATIGQAVAGKSAVIVFDDVNLDDAVSGVLHAGLHAAGRAGSGGSRIFVQGDLYEAFVDALVARAILMPVGDPLDPHTQIGAMISQAEMENVLRQIAGAEAEGARLRTGGHRLVEGAMARGAFVAPTIFDQCTDAMAIVREDVAGPVIAVLPFRDAREVIERANAMPFDRSVGVFCKDPLRGRQVLDALRAGTSWLNHPPAIPVEAPLGGFRSSAAGSEAARSALEPYTRLRRVYVHPGSPARLA